MDDIAKNLGMEASLFQQACDLIHTPDISCVVVKNGQIIHTADGRGVMPLMALYQDDKEKLRHSCVVDRIIGKAAAMILALAGTKAVYGDILSAAAGAYLSDRGIPYQYNQFVDRITDRTGEDMCPIERSVIDIEDPELGLSAIARKMDELRNSNTA